jgi:hypothetical protein
VVAGELGVGGQPGKYRERYCLKKIKILGGGREWKTLGVVSWTKENLLLA